MNMRLTILILLVCIGLETLAQDRMKYNALVREAMDLYTQQEFRASAERFSPRTWWSVAPASGGPRSPRPSG